MEARVGIGQKTAVFQSFFSEIQPNRNVSEPILFNLLVRVLVHVGPSRIGRISPGTWLAARDGFRLFEAIKPVSISDHSRHGSI